MKVKENGSMNISERAVFAVLRTVGIVIKCVIESLFEAFKSILSYIYIMPRAIIKGTCDGKNIHRCTGRFGFLCAVNTLPVSIYVYMSKDDFRFHILTVAISFFLLLLVLKIAETAFAAYGMCKCKPQKEEESDEWNRTD